MVLDLDLNSDLGWETELEKIRLQAYTQHHALHVCHAPTYTHEWLTVVSVARRVCSNMNAAGSRMTTRRLFGHSRALSIDRGAAAGALPHTKPRSSTMTTTPTTPASASATAGFWDPLVVRHEESGGWAKAAPPLLRSSLGGLVHQLASWWLVSVAADLRLFCFTFLPREFSL